MTPIRALLLTCAACSSREVAVVDWVPESASSKSAVLAVHAGDDLFAFAYSLDPRPSPLLPDLDLDAEDAEDARLELVLYDETLAELSLPGGRLPEMPGGRRLPPGDRTFSRDLIDGAWSEGPRSEELDALEIVELRPSPCANLEPRVVRLQTQVEVEDLAFDDTGTLYALADASGGVFRIEDGESHPVALSPAVRVSSGGFAGGRLWIVTATGAVWSGIVAGDRVELERDSASSPFGTRWILENPYGPKPLVMTSGGQLIDLSTGDLIFALDVFDTTDEGSLIYTDAVYFSISKSTLVGRYDGTKVDAIPIPGDNGGGAIADVPGLGLLVGTPAGPIFQLRDRALEPFADLGGVDANTIVPFEGGFVVGSDKGVMYRWVAGLGFCAISAGIVEDLEIGFVYAGGAVFASNSGPDRENAGGQTPVTFVRITTP